LGFVLAELRASREHGRQSEREKAAREENRRDVALERRADFQLRSLLELQEALQSMFRTASAIHYARRLSQARRDDEFGEWHVPAEIGDPHLERMADDYSAISYLAVRVTLPLVQSLASRIRAECGEVRDSRSQEESKKHLDGAADLLEEFNELAGKRIRELWDEVAEGGERSDSEDLNVPTAPAAERHQ
jgi:hypothetical protein